jgi:hypothetical protein
MEETNRIEELENKLEDTQILLEASKRAYDNLYVQYKSLQSELKYPEHHLTVGKLREKLPLLLENGGVYIQRVEDVYFEKHNWKGKMMPSPDFDDQFDEYMPVWCALDYKDGNLYLTPHY